jgi:putative hydrolase of the HAD superfamily
MIKAVFFDLGETLIHFGKVDRYSCFKRGAQATYDYLRSRGRRLPSFRQYHSRHWRAIRRAYLWSRLVQREMDVMQMLQRVCRRMGIALEHDDFLPMANHFYAPLREASRVDPQAHAVLADCRQRGLQLGIISNTMVPAVVLDDHLQREGLRDYFAARVYSCDVGYRKPRRAIFRLALQRLGVAARESLFVGDSFCADVVGANRAGMVSVWRSADGRGRGWFASPDFVIAELREVHAVLDQLENHAPRAGA